MLEGLSEPTTITVSVVGLIALLAVLALLRVLLRRNPGPPWCRYRIGVFLERDPADNDRPDTRP